MNDHDAIGPMGRAFLTSQSAREAFEDLSAAEINALPLSEYAKMTGRSLHGEPAGPVPTDAPPPVPDVSAPASEPAGRTLEELALQDPAAFAQWRASRKSSGENVGIFSGVMSNTAEYRDAASARAGRNAMITSNVQEPRKVGRVYLADDIPPAGRKTYYR